MTDTLVLSPLPAGFLKKVAVPVHGVHLVHQTSIVTPIEPVYAIILKSFGIDNDYRVAHFTGQCCEESDQFCTTMEYASGEAYEGRKDLGNIHPGDGVRYKGRGLIQLTGRTNYRLYGEKLGMDLENNPALAAEPLTALRIACAYWQEKGLSPLADLDDLEGITRKINGGLNGLAARNAAIGRAFNALGYT